MITAVGIDLGTTNTVVSVVRDGRPVTLVDSENRRLIPSIVSFHPNGKVLVGDSAKERRIIDPTSTVYSAKRLMGRPWGSVEVAGARSAMPFELVEGGGHEVLVAVRGEEYTVPEISAFILRRAKSIAEAALGEPVRQAVVTVPANFNDPQREATKLAGKLAGLEVLRILNEPTAAALAYGEASDEKARLAVYDFGGGTFDVTLLDVADGVFQVVATGGDTALGGDDLDELIAGQMRESLLKRFRFEVRHDPTARAMLNARATDLKVELSSSERAEVALNNIVRGEGGALVPASFGMDRSAFERLAGPIIERTIATCTATLAKAGRPVAEIDRVLLVGGSTRIPLVGQRVESYFGQKVSARVNPDEIVAHGAAIQAAALTGGAEVARSSVRPRPSFSFALGRGLSESPPPPSGTLSPVSEPPPVHRSGPPSVVQPVDPPVVPPSQTPGPLTSGSSRPSVPARAGSSKPPMSADQEALLRSFLGVPADTPAPRPPSRPSDHEDLLKAFLGVPADAPPSRQKPSERPQAADIDAELAAFLGAAGPPTATSSPPLPRTTARPGPAAVISELPPAPDLDFPPPRRPAPASTRPAVPASVPAPATALTAPSRPAARPAPLLVDVTPMSLGVETAGGFCDFIIPGNSPVPCDRTRVFRTASDGQTSVIVKICQGESGRFEENTDLGNVRLSGFRAAPRGEVEISVTFEIDADGILNVAAREGSSGGSAVARIELHGAQTDARKLQSMMDRQASSEVV